MLRNSGIFLHKIIHVQIKKDTKIHQKGTNSEFSFRLQLPTESKKINLIRAFMITLQVGAGTWTKKVEWEVVVLNPEVHLFYTHTSQSRGVQPAFYGSGFICQRHWKHTFVTQHSITTATRLYYQQLLAAWDVLAPSKGRLTGERPLWDSHRSHGTPLTSS